MANTESTGTTSVPQRQRLHSRRHSLRYGLQEPLDVTVLRSGVPDSVPGRSLNLGAGGLAAVLAGELLPGEVVGVEIHLPKSAIPLRARARVRHHDKLRCGMEFVGLSADQQAAIRSFAEETKAEPEKDMRPKLPGSEVFRRRAVARSKAFCPQTPWKSVAFFSGIGRHSIGAFLVALEPGVGRSGIRAGKRRNYNPAASPCPG